MKHRISLFLPITAVLALALTACSGGTPNAPAVPEAPSVSPTDPPTAEPTESTDGAPSAAGLEPGEIPPVPLIVLPDLSMADTAIAGATIDMKESIGSYPGLTVTPAVCDASGGTVTGTDTMLLYGDGGGSYTGPDGSVITGNDGSGVFVLNGVEAVVGGDGSGVFDDGTVSIVNGGDGSGTYNDDEVAVVIGGDGSGTWEKGSERIINGGDGSGTYENDEVSIINGGDGSGTYNEGSLSIINDGKGSALVTDGILNGVDIPAEPLPPVPLAGKFPPMGLLAPIESCGTTISLDAGVLFDFGKFDLRPEAAPVLDSLASALTDLNAPALEVSGHTDSVSDDALNQTLSENRADAVSKALESRGVSAAIDAVGYGETHPVAPNELNGQDNPAGRQLNRRVEVFVPAA